MLRRSGAHASLGRRQLLLAPLVQRRVDIGVSIRVVIYHDADVDANGDFENDARAGGVEAVRKTTSRPRPPGSRFARPLRALRGVQWRLPGGGTKTGHVALGSCAGSLVTGAAPARGRGGAGGWRCVVGAGPRRGRAGVLVVCAAGGEGWSFRVRRVPGRRAHHARPTTSRPSAPTAPCPPPPSSCGRRQQARTEGQQQCQPRAPRRRRHAASSAPRARTRPRKVLEVRYLRPPPLGDAPQAHPIAARSGGRPHAREGTPPPQRLPVGRPRPVRKGARNPPSPQNRMAGTVPAQSKRCPPLRTTLRGPTAEWSRSRRAGAPGTVNSAAFLPCPPRQPGRLGATRPTDSLTPGRAPPSLARHTPLTRNPASLFPRPSPPRPLKSAKGTGSPAVDPEEIRSCIPPRDFARSSGRVVATGRPGRATLLQRRRTATSVSASSQTSCL